MSTHGNGLRLKGAHVDHHYKSDRDGVIAAFRLSHIKG